MSFHSEPLPLLTAIATLCLLFASPLSAPAAIVSTNTATATVIDPAQTLSGSSALSVAGAADGSLAAFTVLDFNTSALGFTDQTRAASLNSLSLSLTDLNTNPALATGIIDIYISNTNAINTPASSLTFLSASLPQGIGDQLDTLTQVGNIDLSTTAGRGTTFDPNFTLSPANQTYLLNQINLGNPIRVVLAPDSSSVISSLQGTTPAPPLTAPLLKFNVNTAARIPGDANGDNVVDIQDLTIVANDWQQADFGAAKGDFNDSGFVDILDLTTIANNWQAGVNSGSGSGSSFNEAFASLLTPAATPEPTTLFTLLLAIPLLLCPRFTRPPR